MKRYVTFKGAPLTLVGRVLKEGQSAPDFTVVSGDLKEVTLADLEGKIKVLTSFPSIDTPVCDLQIKEFNKRATGLSDGVVVVGISKDLPFAQKRFCETFDIHNVIVLSDYNKSIFGINYGLLIKELNLLARAVIIVDKNNMVRYIHIVGEVADAPDYDDVLKNLQTVLDTPTLPIAEKGPARCTPCEGGVQPLAKDEITKRLNHLTEWDLVDGKKLVKEYAFKDFVEAKYFVDLIAILAEYEGHHPSIRLSYKKVNISLTTHIAKGLTANDFLVAELIDSMIS